MTKETKDVLYAGPYSSLLIKPGESYSNYPITYRPLFPTSRLSEALRKKVDKVYIWILYDSFFLNDEDYKNNYSQKQEYYISFK